MQITLAEALLRRKELAGKVTQLATIKDKDLFEVRGKRVKVSDTIDDLVLQVPKLTAGQVTHEHDHYAKQLRLCDAAIQRANWETLLTVADSVTADYVAPTLPSAPPAPPTTLPGAIAG